MTGVSGRWPPGPCRARLRPPWPGQPQADLAFQRGRPEGEDEEGQQLERHVEHGGQVQLDALPRPFFCRSSPVPLSLRSRRGCGHRELALPTRRNRCQRLPGSRHYTCLRLPGISMKLRFSASFRRHCLARAHLHHPHQLAVTQLRARLDDDLLERAVGVLERLVQVGVQVGRFSVLCSPTPI